MNKKPEEVQAAAFHVLGYHDIAGGHTPGTFTERLIEAWFHADAFNRAKFRASWPELDHVLTVWSTAEDREAAASLLLALTKNGEVK